jgi:DNA-binding PadR family transcriptional regulator
MSNRHLILGLLLETPMTGYDIKKQLSETMSMIASPGYGAVYPTLHRLLDDKAVTVDLVEQDGKPAKKVYSITASGQEELNSWLQQPSIPDRITREFLLKVFLAKNLEPDHLKEHLEKRRKDTEAFYTTLKELSAQPDRQINGHHQLVIDYAQEICTAEMRWLDRVAQTFSVEGQASDEEADT